MFSFQGTCWVSQRNSMKPQLLPKFHSTSLKYWWRVPGSNRWPPACKAGALPAELTPHIGFLEVVGQGLAFLRKSHGGCNSPPDCCQEPPFESILAFSPLFPRSSSAWLPFLLFFEVVGQSGLEPPTSRLSVVCSSQLSYWPVSAPHLF